MMQARIREILDRFYREYDFAGRIQADPIEIPRRYRSKADAEVAGFIAASFAYGKVGLFKPVVERILSAMGRSPASFLYDFDLRRARRVFSGIKYRFNENEDILAFLFALSVILRRYGSIEAAFMASYHRDDPHTGPAIIAFVEEMVGIDTSRVYGKREKPSGLLQLFPSPAKGSPCKRLNLFLRWMVRDRDIDLGLWKGIPKSDLVIPLDTHIARISRCLGLTSRRSQDWTASVEITRALKSLDPDDPLKYDFALCHHGISGMCNGGDDVSHCLGCRLNLPVA